MTPESRSIVMDTAAFLLVSGRSGRLGCKQ